MALIVTVTLVALVHDVNRIAAQSAVNRASLNRTFATLVTGILLDEDRWGSRVGYLLSHGSTMSRVEFAGRLASDRVDGTDLLQRATILRRPALAHQVQTTFVTVTAERVAATEGVLMALARALALPSRSGETSTAREALHLFVLSDTQWALARRSLVGEPGHVRLPRSTFALSGVPLAAEIAALEVAPSLGAHRGVTVAVVAITPAPLPAPVGELLMLASSPLSATVVVRNLAYVSQPFAIRLSITPASAKDRQTSQLIRGLLAPLSSTAVTFNAVALSPNEHGTVSIALTNTPLGPNGGGARRYTLIVASSPVK